MSDRKQVKKDSVLLDLSTPHKQTIDEYLIEITDELNYLKNEYITNDVSHHELYTQSYGYDGAYEIHLITYRLETDEEYFERIKRIQTGGKSRAQTIGEIREEKSQTRS